MKDIMFVYVLKDIIIQFLQDFLILLKITLNVQIVEKKSGQQENIKKREMKRKISLNILKYIKQLKGIIILDYLRMNNEIERLLRNKNTYNKLIEVNI